MGDRGGREEERRVGRDLSKTEKRTEKNRI